MAETTRFDPLLPPSEEGQSVFRCYLDRNPLADMRATPNEWLLKERGRTEAIADRLAKLEDGIRALADKHHNADAEQPGAVVRADTFELELRALLGEDGE